MARAHPVSATDTAGDLAFVVALVSLVVSRYLQLRRRRAAPGPASGQARRARDGAGDGRDRGGSFTAVVIYLSFNAVTHPVTLGLQLTDLLPGPSEGTTRVIALAICLVGAVATSRYLRATAPRQSQPARVPERH